MAENVKVAHLIRHTFTLTIEVDPREYNRVVGMVGVEDNGRVSLICAGEAIQSDQIRLVVDSPEEAWEAIHEARGY